jgi:CHAT domain-containing protein
MSAPHFLAGLIASILLAGSGQVNAASCSPVDVNPAEINALIRTGEAEISAGLITVALDTLTKASKEAEGSADPEMVAAADGALGNAYLQARNIDLARPLLEKSIAISAANGLTATSAKSTNNLANLLMAADRAGEAATLYQKAIHAAQASGDKSLVALAEINEARAMLKLGKPAETATLLGNAVAGTPDGRNDPFAAVALVSAGRLALETAGRSGDQSDQLGANTLKRAASMAQSSGDFRTASLADGFAGAGLERWQNWTPAEQLTERAIFAAQAARAPDLLYRWDWQLGRIKAAEGDVKHAIEAYRRAVEALESIRGDIPLEYREGRSSYLEAYGAMYIQLADLLLQRAHASGEEPGEVRPLLEEARATLETSKVAELRDYFRDHCLDAIEAKQKTIDTLSSSTVVLYPVILPDRLELLLYFSDGPVETVVPVSSVRLKASVEQFRRLVEKRETNEYLGPSRDLYRWLITPIMAELQRRHIDTIVWLPDGALRTIPLSAVGNGNRYVIDDFAVATAPGLSLVDPQPAGATQSRNTLVAGLSMAMRGFPALPNVRDEIASVQHSEGGKVLLDADFRTSDLIGSLKDSPYSILHIASHGQFDHNPDQSFLLTYDGELTLDKLEGAIKLTEHRDSALELLVLSACQTAAGDDRAALGLAGIAIKAGARSAVASLWYVDDVATAQLFRDFYADLQGTTLSKAQALRRAQLEVKSDIRLHHPAFWSPFLLIGNWL